METATLTGKVNMWLHEHLAMKTSVKLLGGLALGALLITAIALPFGLNYADEPSRPLTSGQYPGCFEIDGGCYDPHAWEAIALPIGLNYADEPNRPLTSGQYPGCFETDGGCYDPHAWEAIAVPFGLNHADEPSRPSTIKQAADLADVFQTAVWLPGDTYPVFGR